MSDVGGAVEGRWEGGKSVSGEMNFIFVEHVNFSKHGITVILFTSSDVRIPACNVAIYIG